MSGLDRDRPLWTVTVVEGLQGGQAAVIIKMSHVMTDGVGSLVVLALLGDLTRKPRDLGAMPAIPQPESESPFELAAEAVTLHRAPDPRIRRPVRERGGACDPDCGATPG